MYNNYAVLRTLEVFRKAVNRKSAHGFSQVLIGVQVNHLLILACYVCTMYIVNNHIIQHLS